MNMDLKEMTLSLMRMFGTFFIAEKMFNRTAEVLSLKDKISLKIFKVLKAELLNEDHSNI